MDGRPDYVSNYQRYRHETRPHSTAIQRERAQRMEQGMGRAVRGSGDYCIVFIIGTNLVDEISEDRKRRFFSPEIQKQIEIGLQISDQMRKSFATNKVNSDLNNLIEQCLDPAMRDKGWKQFYKKEMSKIENTFGELTLLDVFVDELAAEEAFRNHQFDDAVKHLDRIISKQDPNGVGRSTLGWYKQLKASMYYEVDRQVAMKIQQSAFTDNNNLFRPEIGVKYKATKFRKSRSKNIEKFILQFENLTAMKIKVSTILSRLVFGASASEFEAAMAGLGEMLGFESEMPDKKLGYGPDNLWQLSKRVFWIFECKNEVVVDRGISKREVGQLTNHVAWFNHNYEDVTCMPIFIHPADSFEKGVFCDEDIWVLGATGMKNLRNNVDGFFKSINSQETPPTTFQIDDLLEAYKLDLDSLQSIYLKKMIKNR
ncbi:MAG: hypothetical protein IH840_14185 [Candidatus Heimdallarchaeota archaeon]|nr:hypothetical protein [Candidatus Heimdallarchaeota archaeon]